MKHLCQRVTVAVSVIIAVILAAACSSANPLEISNGRVDFDTTNEHISGTFSGSFSATSHDMPTTVPPTVVPPTIAPPTLVPPTPIPPTPIPPTPVPTPNSNLLPAVDPPYPGLSKNGPLRAIEVQAWWTDFGHIHATAILPYGQSTSGLLTIPVRALLHNNPSKFWQVQLSMDDGTVGQKNIATAEFVKTCPYSGVGDVECAWDWEFKVDTTKYGDGWKSIYLQAFTVTPDGTEYRTSSRIPVRFANGNASAGDVQPDDRFTGCERTSFMGRAWYGLPVDNYADARAICVPMAPVSGLLQQLFVGGAGSATESVRVTISKNHDIPAIGKWLHQAPRVGRELFFKPGSNGAQFVAPIDTKTLQNGWHSIQVRTVYPTKGNSVCDYCSLPAFTGPDQLEGVAIYWIYADNGPGND